MAIRLLTPPPSPPSSSNQATEIDIAGVPVTFPCRPYQQQVVFMEKLMTALQNSHNALLESPTGTGKTAALLCALCAWSDAVAVRASAHEMAVGGVIDQGLLSILNEATGLSAPPSFLQRRPRIIYLSRTHSQLNQVVAQLKKTSYKPKIAVLSSREHSCLHERVKTMQGGEQIAECKKLTKANACALFANLSKDSGTDVQALLPPVQDIEDMVEAGKKHQLCPYFMSRNRLETADMIFMPYSYVADPFLRRLHQSVLQGAVLVFDEGIPTSRFFSVHFPRDIYSPLTFHFVSRHSFD
jgi:regulator of telomere elongation helicase 1